MNRLRLFPSSMSSLIAASILVAVMLGWSPNARAQWLSQTITLKGGWNAVYLNVDASHTNLDRLVGADNSNPIQEIWLWQPPVPPGQFIDSPERQVGIGTEWSTWKRNRDISTSLNRLNGNAAYLVRVSAAVASYSWTIKGKPVPPSYRWSLSGLNLIGFSTPSASPPFSSDFLSPAPDLRQTAEMFQYPGGNLGPGNPSIISSLLYRNTPLPRGRAYWMRAGDTFNNYFGPFEVIIETYPVINFGVDLGQSRVRLRNSTTSPLAVTMVQLPSESAPSLQKPVHGTPTLLLRGPLNTNGITFTYSNLASGPTTWTLAPAGQQGSEVEVLIGLNRSPMNGNPGDIFASILRFTDSLNLSQVDVGVAAEMASKAGLWVGGAQVDYVSNYLKKYAKATNDADLAALLVRLQLTNITDGTSFVRDPNTDRVLVFGGTPKKTGSYLLDGPVKVDSGTVARSFPLRLILHNTGTQSVLLQKAFLGLGQGSNAVVTIDQDLLLQSELSSARRVSAVHLPLPPGNVPWALTGSFAEGSSLSATIRVAHDDQSSNPFLHTYHPDHDNLDALFASSLAQGIESYGVDRQVTMTFTAPANDFDSLTKGSQALNGDYAELLTFNGKTGTQSKQFNVLGRFTLKRVSTVPVLTTN